MLRHHVALRFKTGTSEQAKQALYDDLSALQHQIDGITAFHAAPNISPEPLSRGFDDMFWFDFRDAAVRDAYLVHPAHQAIGARIVAATEDGIAGIFVCDVQLP